MDETTLPSGILPKLTPEQEKEAMLLAKKEAEASKYFETNFPPKSESDRNIIKELARKRAEAQVEELKRLEPEHILEKPMRTVAEETAEKAPGVLSKEVVKEAAEEKLRNKMITQDLLNSFKLKSAAAKAAQGAGKVARGAARLAGPVGNLVDFLSPSETVSEEEEMKELEKQKSKENFLATKKLLQKARNPASED